MRYSRLRLRLAGWFALGMVLGLALLDVTLFALLRRRADARLDSQLVAEASGLAEAVRREAAEVPAPPLRQAVHDALEEWPRSIAALSVRAGDGSRLGAGGDSLLLPALARAESTVVSGGVGQIALDREGDLRFATAQGPGGTVVTVAQSTAALNEDLETLAWWLGASIPLVLLVSLPAGYLLARRALAPFHLLAQEVDRITPGLLDRRLPVQAPPDELDRIAEQVNRLLDRLASAQQQTRRFLGEAAHQLRTPLTLVRGESELAIGQPRSAEEYRAALGRISLASTQMSRRVDELFLLARAEAGEPLPRTTVVALDEIALEAADLMRGRAQAAGHRLELIQMEEAEVLGDGGLLREAALELLENACRHGTTEAPIGLAVRRTTSGVTLEVQSMGPATGPAPTDGSGDRLGLAIVRWIATAHGGTLSVERSGEVNVFAITLPATAGAGG